MKIDCRELASEIRAGLKKEVAELTVKYRQPRLMVIMVGNDPASEVYVRNKRKACEEVGIHQCDYRLEEEISTDELIEVIQSVNHDDGYDGILVQLPLPAHIDQKAVIDAIAPAKDVDGFTSANVAALWQGRKCIVPCTPKGIIRILDHIGFNYEGANAVVLGRSQIVGLPIAKLLLDRNCSVEVCHSKTRCPAIKTYHADLVVSAMNQPLSLSTRIFNPGRDTVLIDVTIGHDENGKLCGDAARDLYKLPYLQVTPVPGGVGPMTVACLMENVVECFKNRFEHVQAQR